MAMHMVGAIVWGALGAACIVRGFYHPHRAVVKTGAVLKCAGETNQFGICDPGDVIETETGEPVFAAASAVVADVGDYYVNLVVNNESVILAYEGLEPSVQKGQHVGPGQKIGTSDGRLVFIVTQFKPNGVAEYVPPSAWLAVRGFELVKDVEGSEEPYCLGGRDIVVPAAAKNNCDLHAPRKAGFALLPVTVELQ